MKKLLATLALFGLATGANAAPVVCWVTVGGITFDAYKILYMEPDDGSLAIYFDNRYKHIVTNNAQRLMNQIMELTTICKKS